MATKIKFGTSGWRAIMADEFTVENVRRACMGIAKFVVSQPLPAGQARHRILVGRDTRFLGETFVDVAASVLAAEGVVPEIIAEAAPTPAISYAILDRKASGSINFSASHNPPEYNGIKFNSADGAPSLPHVTKAIEENIAALAEDAGLSVGKPKVERAAADVKPAYLKRIAELVNLKAIQKSGIKIVVDPVWGTGRGYQPQLLADAGVPVTTVHDYRDVLFGGYAPEPDDHLLAECKAAMKKTGAAIGIATDGDADRFGIVDADGTFISANYVIAVLFDYLMETRGWKNGVAKSVATTNLINAIAEKAGVPLFETPVGFKYIGELILQDKILIGGEESGGLTIRGHVPEKDGVIAGLLMAESVAVRGKSIGAQLQDIFARVGAYYSNLDNFRITPETKAAFSLKIKGDPAEMAGLKVAKIVRTDGLKLIFTDGSWALFRLSGTEPLVRAYTEARDRADVQKLAAAAKHFVMEQ